MINLLWMALLIYQDHWIVEMKRALNFNKIWRSPLRDLNSIKLLILQGTFKGFIIHRSIICIDIYFF